MSKSIAQNSQDARDLLSSAKKFIKRFHMGASLKAAGAYKGKGLPVVTVFQYLFSVMFTHQSAYADIRSEKHNSGFSKDTVYRFLNMQCTNWIRFTTLLALRIIQDVFIPRRRRRWRRRDARTSPVSEESRNACKGCPF